MDDLPSQLIALFAILLAGALCLEKTKPPATGPITQKYNDIGTGFFKTSMAIGVLAIIMIIVMSAG